MRKRLMVISLFLCSFALQAQDVVFSQFSNTTIMINPAITGNYLGVVRTTLNQRIQNPGFAYPYSTSILTVDKSIRRKGKRKDRISYGAYFVRDGALTGDRIELRQYSASIGFHKLIGKQKFKHQFLSMGAQMGSASRTAMTNTFRYDRQITKDGFDPNLSSGEYFYRDAISYPTLNVGLLYTFADSSFKKSLVKFTAGYGVFNVVAPVEAVSSINYQKLGIRHHVNSSMVYWFVGTKFFLKMDALFSVQGNAHQLKGRMIFDYWYNRKYAFLGGFNFSVSRSWGPVIGFGFRNVNIIYSIDFSGSDTPAGMFATNEITFIYLNPMPGRERVYALRAGDASM